MKNALMKSAISVAVVIVAIIVTGWLLDEAGNGTFGSMAKDLAKKTTRGYGV